MIQYTTVRGENGDILLFSHNFPLPWPPEGTPTRFQPKASAAPSIHADDPNGLPRFTGD